MLAKCHFLFQFTSFSINHKRNVHRAPDSHFKSPNQPNVIASNEMLPNDREQFLSNVYGGTNGINKQQKRTLISVCSINEHCKVNELNYDGYEKSTVN